MEKILTNQVYASDPAHDIWKQQRHPLDYIFHPRSVAVIGASEREGSVGRTFRIQPASQWGVCLPSRRKRGGAMSWRETSARAGAGVRDEGAEVGGGVEAEALALGNELAVFRGHALKRL